MSETTDPSRPLRQWRVTITEDREGRAVHAHLSWRTFPCAATKWDGSRWFTIEHSQRAPIVSLDALRDLLGVISRGEWVEARYPRQ